jgi:1,4-alpha-glucan branching enzyme
LDPRFGTEDDLRALVDAAHKRGIRVLLDVVYNHVGYDSQYLTNPKTKGWAAHGGRRHLRAGRPHLVRERVSPT